MSDEAAWRPCSNADVYHWRDGVGPQEKRPHNVNGGKVDKINEKKIGLMVDEWGTWYEEKGARNALYQQNSLRDALVAALNFNIFHEHAERVTMSSIAQMVNVLQHAHQGTDVPHPGQENLPAGTLRRHDWRTPEKAGSGT